MTRSVGSFLLIYASETGQAKAIAEEIAEKCPQHELEARLFCISMSDKKFWLEKESVAVIISSTTGDGDPPDTATKFYRRLHKKTLSKNHLENLNFALLGLGDTNYSNFCNCGKNIDKRLVELGAKQFYDSGFADDATGLEIVVDPWIDGLFPALKKFLDCDQTDESDIKQSGDTDNILFRNNEPSTDNFSSDSKITDMKADTASESKDKTSFLSGEGDNPQNINQDIKASTLSNSLTKQASDQEKRNLATTIEEMVSDSTRPSELLTGVVEKIGEFSECSETLSGSNLSVPLCPASYIEIDYLPEQKLDTSTIAVQNGCSFPSSASAVSKVAIMTMVEMTRSDALKKTLKMELDISECGWSYEPGDAIGIVCPNDRQDVEYILHRKKKNASIPSHYPEISTLNYLLTNCCDIRSVPKKAFLRALVECTSEDKEKRRLQELCSKQGAEEYTKFIRTPGLSVIDILLAFPSCQPSIQLLLEQCPRLLPRPYSASSSTYVTPGKLECVFNVVEIPGGEGRGYSRKGVCTGWLDHISKNLQTTGEITTDCSEKLANLSLQEGGNIMIDIFLRSNQYFRAPDDLSTPYIMIGPGTGVAPFIGFLRQRQYLVSKNEHKSSDIGDVWLFYGCRHEHRDFLFRNELEEFTRTGVLKRCIVSFSREQEGADEVNSSKDTGAAFYTTKGKQKYVQDNLRAFQQHIASLIYDQNASVYVCGDAKGMARSVGDAFIEILQNVKDMTIKEATAYIMNMRIQKKYLEDVWT